MKTVIVNVPDKDETLFGALVKKPGFKARTLSEEEKEDMATAKWIDKGMESEDATEEIVYATFRKHGVKV
jgi:hypothetical protein